MKRDLPKPAATDRFSRISAEPAPSTCPAAERSTALFGSGFYCAESVLLAIAESQGLSDPAVPKIATGFCGRVSRSSGMCGALAGGIMAIGLLTGRSAPDESRDRCYALSHNLVGRFRERYGTTQCTELLGCDLSTAEGSRDFRDRGLIEKICVPVTRQTTAWVEIILGERDAIRHPLL
jgi:C_GCAxxG_C_C family probable redox protein